MQCIVLERKKTFVVALMTWRSKMELFLNGAHIVKPCVTNNILYTSNDNSKCFIMEKKKCFSKKNANYMQSMYKMQ